MDLTKFHLLPILNVIISVYTIKSVFYHIMLNLLSSTFNLLYISWLGNIYNPPPGIVHNH